MKKQVYIPFELFVPEQYMTDDLNIAILPVETGVENPYSSKGDMLIAVEFTEATDILEHLTHGSFILLEGIEFSKTKHTTMRLTIEEDWYTFTPTSNIATQVIVKRKENLYTLNIVGKVIFSFHDFANLCDLQENFREILSFPAEGLEMNID